MSEQLCKYCGFDLRASPEYCPECGRERTLRRSWFETIPWRKIGRWTAAVFSLAVLGVIGYRTLQPLYATWQYASGVRQRSMPPSSPPVDPLFQLQVTSVRYNPGSTLHVHFQVTATREVLIRQRWPEAMTLYVDAGGRRYVVATSMREYWLVYRRPPPDQPLTLPIGPMHPPAPYKYGVTDFGLDHMFYPLDGFAWPTASLPGDIEGVRLKVEIVHEGPGGTLKRSAVWSSDYTGKIEKVSHDHGQSR